MTILSTLSSDLASVVETAGRGVVQIEARRGGAASGVVWAEDLVITANHVLTRDENINVGVGDGEQMEGALIGRDPTTDLALLHLNRKISGVPQWTGVASLRVGHLVLALGRPGRTVRAILGIVSAFGEGWRTSAGGSIDNYIQTDASFFPGFSGGPLITVEGTVLGMTTSGLLRGATVAIPTSTVKSVVDQLLKNGRISRGYLGVGVQPARLPPDLARQSGQETGLLIISVETGSPGENAGLVMGDTILNIAGNPMSYMEDLLAALGRDRIGASVDIHVLRAGKVQDLKATIGERPNV